MFSAFERTVAFRYLRSRRKERFVSVIAGFSLLGIALGVATLIIVMSVMNGFRAELLGRVLGISGHITVSAVERQIEDFDALGQRLARVDGVIYAAPMVQGQAMATVRGTATGTVVRGMRSEDLARRDLIAESVTVGSLDRFEGAALLLGYRLAGRLGVGVGDAVRLIAPEGTPGPFGVTPRTKTYEVVGLFDVGMYEYDSSFAFMPLNEANVFFRTGEGGGSIELLIANPERTGEVAARVRDELGAGYRVTDWRLANASFVNALEVERNVMFLILTLIIVVAAFNIVSSMIMLVKDKGRDIAILRAMGATRGMIVRIFLLTGSSVGIAGTLAGFALGLWFAANVERIRGWLEALTGTDLFAAEIYFLSRLPSKVDPVEVALVVAMAFVLTIVATLYPAWRAGRLVPAEGLRDE